jgi:hypothetical protein
MNPNAEIAVVIVGALAGAALGSLIAAVILRLAAQWALKKEVTLGNAYLTVLIAWGINLVIWFFLAMLATGIGGSDATLGYIELVLIPVAFLIQSAIIAPRLQVTFRDACGLSIVMMVIAFVTFGAIAIIAGGIASVADVVTG